MYDKTSNTLKATLRLITHCTNRPTVITQSEEGGSLLLRFILRSALREQLLLFFPEFFFCLTRLLQL